MNKTEQNFTYTTSYSDEFLKDIKKFTKSGNKQILAKIAELLQELRTLPKVGTGKPEALKGYGKREIWSRRINNQHRLVYEIFEPEKKVKILTAFGHYNDK
ncbi:Txe/YoeB family addiction module toxin [Capnocytophaga sp. oral taxon 878]|uniref:Txe/YoeB family addiction module toxin n=1 Tax=Capnocytophaga sp. oral taxon 878 TaxID=1316596 RepID=UPI000D025270|nr:Txe/YoeB family addiction module toxin [Capnocytophaga sp. oral taxon 878]AVM48987.1 Txe/YoeB family addiction module toxin [Capnocytophaga sp. oral taxon 878]